MHLTALQSVLLTFPEYFVTVSPVYFYLLCVCLGAWLHLTCVAGFFAHSKGLTQTRILSGLHQARQPVPKLPHPLSSDSVRQHPGGPLVTYSPVVGSSACPCVGRIQSSGGRASAPGTAPPAPQHFSALSHAYAAQLVKGRGP